MSLAVTALAAFAEVFDASAVLPGGHWGTGAVDARAAGIDAHARPAKRKRCLGIRIGVALW
jgi:hypothetical protein